MVLVKQISDYDQNIRGHLSIGDGKINFKKFFNKSKFNKNQIFILEVLPYSLQSTYKDLIGSKNRLEELLKN